MVFILQQTVLITGGSRGIGRATALAFYAKGYNIVINYNSNEEQALSVAKKVGGTAIKADVSDFAQVKAMFDSIGHIDVLVNNAGIAQAKLFTDITESDWDNMFGVNVKGIYNCCKCALPGMINKKQGRIINISSIWGITGASCEVHYSASKAAVIGFTKALAKEVGPSGINVNCVAPGVIMTDMNGRIDSETLEELKNETPLNRLGTACEVADTIVFLASGEAGFITGQVISPNGGMVI